MLRSFGLLVLCGALLGVPGAHAQDLSLSAEVGPLRETRGTALVESTRVLTRVLPPLWSVYRVVHFRVCAPDGRPLAGRVNLELEIEPLTPDVTPESMVSRSVSTDEQGRFTGVYGSASRRPRSPWPEGMVSMELHRFRVEGRTVATFILERVAGDVRLYRGEEAVRGPAVAGTPSTVVRGQALVGRKE